MANKQHWLRFPQSVSDRVTVVQEALHKGTGVKSSKAAVLLGLLEAGLEQIEAKLGIEPPAKPKTEPANKLVLVEAPDAPEAPAEPAAEAKAADAPADPAALEGESGEVIPMGDGEDDEVLPDGGPDLESVETEVFPPPEGSEVSAAAEPSAAEVSKPTSG